MTAPNPTAPGQVPCGGDAYDGMVCVYHIPPDYGESATATSGYGCYWCRKSTQNNGTCGPIEFEEGEG